MLVACRQIAGLTLMALSLAACGESGMSDLQRFVDTAYQDAKPEIEPLPEMKPFKAFEYSAANLDDPFNLANVISETAVTDTNSALRPDPNRIREPLERYPLDALRMVGTLSQEGVPRVIMQTSEGISYYLKVGNYMGQDDGVVTRIDTDRQLVVLTETFLNVSNRWETREVELTPRD